MLYMTARPDICNPKMKKRRRERQKLSHLKIVPANQESREANNTKKGYINLDCAELRRRNTHRLFERYQVLSGVRFSV